MAPPSHASGSPHRAQTGATPLFIAARSGCVEIVRLLLDAGADKTIAGQWGRPIDWVCRHDEADQANRAEIEALLR